MSNTRRLSAVGKDVVSEHRSKTNITQVAWHQKAFCSMPTLRRFLQGHSIRTDIFISLCRVIGIDNWQEVAEPSVSQIQQKPFAVFGKVSEVSKLDIDDLVKHLEKYVDECVSTKSTTGTLIITGYFNDKNQDIVELILSQIGSNLIEGKISIHQEEVSLIAD